MHLMIFGTLVIIGLLWQAKLFQKLLATPNMWSKHLSDWPQSLALPFLAVVWGKLLNAPLMQMMAIPALLCYVVQMLDALTSTGRAELKKNPSFAASVTLPSILASTIAIGAALQAIFIWQSATASAAMEFSRVNNAVLNAIAFGLLFQVKALFSPIIVCINLAWTVFTYLTTGNVEVWSAMENLLLLVLEPASAASAAPWYVALMFALAAFSTFGDVLKSASALD